MTDTESATPTGGDSFATSRHELRRVATHILARGRAAHGGRFGLRATATGIGTPAFGPDESVLRIAGTTLVREFRVEGKTQAETMELTGRSLSDGAVFAQVDLSAPFEVGGDTAAIGNTEAPLQLDAASVEEILRWYRTGAEIIDALLPALVDPTVAQLWPEHCDLALDAATASGRVTIGACPGDDGVPEPYVYVGPWDPGRPGDPTYWNAPYGAVLTRSDLVGVPDVVGAATAFVRRGIDLLGPV